MKSVLTLKSGRQWRRGGSGGYGAPSRRSSVSVISTFDTLLCMMFAVSRARVIVECIIAVYGNSSFASRWPVSSACWIPVHTQQHIMLYLSAEVRRQQKIVKTATHMNFSGQIRHVTIFILFFFIIITTTTTKYLNIWINTY